MKELNPDGTIKQPKVEYEKMVTSTTTYICPHKNGTFFSVKFFIFKKELYFCEDCHCVYSKKFIEKLIKEKV